MIRQHTHNRGHVPHPKPAPILEYAGPYWPHARELTAREIASLMSRGEPDLASDNNWAYAPAGEQS